MSATETNAFDYERPHRHWPVVIVGGGPAGLVTATTLAGAGTECLLVDRHPEPSPLPRATVVSLRSMELLRAWGLEPAVLAGANDVEWTMLVAPTLAEAARGHLVEVGYPSREQSAALSPTAPACVPQDHLEEVLLDHLRAQPAVTVQRSVAMVALRAVADGHLVTLRDMASGRTWSVTARYVVGADGAHSAMRSLAGIGTTTTTDLADVTTMVIRAPLWDLLGEHRYGIYAIEHPEAAATFLPAGRHDRWVVGFGDGEKPDDGHDSTTAGMVERIRLAAGDPKLPVEVGPASTFSFTGGMADRFRHGDVFLVGDAAHRVTPRGGTGMNTAIASGFDLGWKLSWVLRGWAPPSLLDTYEAERRIVAEHQVSRSLDPAGSRRRAVDEVHVDLGGRLRHLWLTWSGQPDRSTLDLIGPGLTVLHVDGADAAPVPAPPGLSAPTTVHHLGAMTARALGIPPGQPLVLRPDGLPISGSHPLGRRLGGSQDIGHVGGQGGVEPAMCPSRGERRTTSSGSTGTATGSASSTSTSRRGNGPRS